MVNIKNNKILLPKHGQVNKNINIKDNIVQTLIPYLTSMFSASQRISKKYLK